MLSTTVISRGLGLASLVYHVQAALTLAGPADLVQCSTVNYTWTGGVPGYSLMTGPTGYSASESQGSTGQLASWTVDWPAGTVINVRLNSGLYQWNAGDETYAYAGTKVVLPNDNADCIPASHQNATRVLSNQITFTSLPAELAICNATSISWTGGTAPYTVLIVPVDSEDLTQTFTTDSTSLTWTPDYPTGTSIYFTVAGGEFDTSTFAYTPTMYLQTRKLNTLVNCTNPAYVNATTFRAPTDPLDLTTTNVDGSPIFHSRFRDGLTAGMWVALFMMIALIVVIYVLGHIIRKRQAAARAYRILEQDRKTTESESKGKSSSTDGDDASSTKPTSSSVV